MKRFFIIVLAVIVLLSGCTSEGDYGIELIKQDAFEEGYNKGYEEAMADFEEELFGNRDDYDSGYEDGYSEGYQEGYSEAEEDVLNKLSEARETYDDGYEDGIEIGYFSGYEDGYKDGKDYSQTIYENKGYFSSGGTYQNSDYEEADESYNYVLNKNTEKFHKPSCSSADDIKPKNREYSNETREQIISRGFVPCKKCNP